MLTHTMDPTHYRGDQTPNVLDLIFSKEENMVTDLKHEAPLGKSHQMLMFDFTCYTAEQDEVKSDRFNFVKGDYDKLKNMMGAHAWEEELKDLDAMKAWQYSY